MPFTENNMKRDPRVKRTHQLLRTTFQALLGEKDFQAITIQDIVDRADVNRATFYAHFEDKFALLNYSVWATLQEKLEDKSPDTQNLTLSNLRALALSILEFGANEHCHPSNRNLGPVLIAPRVQQFIYETLLDWISKAQTDATSRLTTPEQAALALSWVISGGRFRWLSSNRRGSAENYVDEMMVFL